MGRDCCRDLFRRSQARVVTVSAVGFLTQAVVLLGEKASLLLQLQVEVE